VHAAYRQMDCSELNGCMCMCTWEIAGASEMLMANAVTQLAARTPGKEAIAIEAYARALRMVCTHSLCNYYPVIDLSGH